eukprot:1162143-Pelagomonas_calceolata.AAC.39
MAGQQDIKSLKFTRSGAEVGSKWNSDGQRRGFRIIKHTRPILGQPSPSAADSTESVSYRKNNSGNAATYPVCCCSYIAVAYTCQGYHTNQVEGKLGMIALARACGKT